jgi:hypothetical protein
MHAVLRKTPDLRIGMRHIVTGYRIGPLGTMLAVTRR